MTEPDAAGFEVIPAGVGGTGAEIGRLQAEPPERPIDLTQAVLPALVTAWVTRRDRERIE